MIWQEDGFVLSSGRRVDANNAIVGMSPTNGHIVAEGYDGGFDTRDWSEVERAELALEMARLWVEWAQYGTTGVEEGPG